MDLGGGLARHRAPASHRTAAAGPRAGGVDGDPVQPLGQLDVGLHHVGRYVADHPAAVAEATAAGFVALQSARGFGAEGDGAFAYFKHPDVALIVELIEAPRVRIEPEFVYPPSGG